MIDTVDESFAGEHKLYVEARSETAVTNVVEYSFTLFLLVAWIPEFEKSNEAPSFAKSDSFSENTLKTLNIAMEGIFIYEIPEPIDEDGDEIEM